MDKPEFKSKNQHGSFKTEKPIGTPPKYETIDDTKVKKIKKKTKKLYWPKHIRIWKKRIRKI